MKTLEEQIAELQDRLNKLENNLTERSEEYEQCCEYECECGCDEPETEIEPELEQVILRRGEVLTEDDELEQTISFTKKELIEFTATLTKRALVFAKEAVADTELDVDSLVSLELNTWSGNTIEVELDKDTIVDNICSGIDDAVMLDDDSVEDEIGDVLRVIGKIS
jgi:SMC interacting uncharacterized protein involved in chromosome segregation